MKNKKGFTLIELLAVIVILAIIALIATPIILNMIENAKKGAAKDSAYGYIEAIEYNNSIADLELNNNYTKIPDGEDLDVTSLNIKVKGSKPESGKVTIEKGNVTKAELCINNYKVKYNGQEAKVDGKCNDTKELIYKEEILNGADPVIKNELIPVTIADNGVVTKADVSKEWYSYENKKWANAVILNDETKTYNNGETIPESDIESYFVWIPKYKYKLFDLGNYETYSGTMQPEKNNAKEIEIVFGTSSTNDNNIGECTTPGTSGETGNCEVGEYMTHPAFLAFNTKGLWIGKYETGYLGATSTTEAQITSTDSNMIIIKPNVYSWRYNSISNWFLLAYNYNRKLDSHMMKNTEWGAVAYLSHSKYGINGEININNNNSYLTGYSAVNSTDQSDYPGESGTDTNVTLPYNTKTGYLASTTGNITGIYDMSGGALEYMASYMANQYGNSNFKSDPITTYGKEYFDKYSSTSTITSYTNRILGDATGEIGPFYYYQDGDGYTRYHNNWYADDSFFVDYDNPWFCRGGDYFYGLIAGQLRFGRGPGGIYNTDGFRLVLAT